MAPARDARRTPRRHPHDRDDLRTIFDAVGEPAAGEGDRRDVDGDGRITLADAAGCAGQCTNPNCEPSCGLLGVEPLVVLGAVAWRRRARASRRRE